MCLYSSQLDRNGGYVFFFKYGHMTVNVHSCLETGDGPSYSTLSQFLPVWGLNTEGVSDSTYQTSILSLPD